MFDLDKFIADLRATLGERSQQPMKDVVARVMSDPASLFRRIGEPSEFGVKVLHHAPDLTVLNVIWAPETGNIAAQSSDGCGNRHVLRPRGQHVLASGPEPREIPDRGGRR